MYGINSFLLLVLPLIFQIIFGRNFKYETIKLSFFKVSVISFLSQILLSCLAFQIVSHNLRMNSNGQIRCGMPLLGLIFFELIFILILVITIGIQYFMKRYYNRNTK